ncbi:MAG: yddE, partial [Myxococcaceae bacterium]|nr:yddE [Myxococcaceae bacterium]
VLLHLVDAFADRPFTGNPAAVCLLDAPRSDEWMQQLAYELGHSETAYVLRVQDGLSLRWFSPTMEVQLCGHATLASAHVLWNLGRAQGAIAFQTKSGVINCERTGKVIYLDMPRSTIEDVPPPVGLLSALGGLRPVALKRVSTNDILVELPDEDSVQKLVPDFLTLAQVKARGVMITARSKNPEFDFVSRFFAPSLGIDEDPVTGSAHCALTPYWADKLGKQTMRARQLSKRGGVLELELKEDRVRMGGRACTVFTGAVTV